MKGGASEWDMRWMREQFRELEQLRRRREPLRFIHLGGSLFQLTGGSYKTNAPEAAFALWRAVDAPGSEIDVLPLYSGRGARPMQAIWQQLRGQYAAIRARSPDLADALEDYIEESTPLRIVYAGDSIITRRSANPLPISDFERTV
jgi:hypothetical protein